MGCHENSARSQKKNGWDGAVCYGYVGSLEGWGSSTDSWLVAGLSLSLDPHYGEQSWRAEDRVPLTSCLPLVQGRPQALKADSSLVPVPLSFQPGLQLGISYYWRQLKERSVPQRVSCGMCQRHPQEKNLHAVDRSHTAGRPTHDPPNWTRRLCPHWNHGLWIYKLGRSFSFPHFLLHLRTGFQAWLGLGTAEFRVLKQTSGVSQSLL